MNDVTLQLLSESKEKLSATEDALRSFEDLKQFIIAPGSSFLLLLRGGVPERILVERPGTDVGPGAAKSRTLSELRNSNDSWSTDCFHAVIPVSWRS